MGILLVASTFLLIGTIGMVCSSITISCRSRTPPDAAQRRRITHNDGFETKCFLYCPNPRCGVEIPAEKLPKDGTYNCTKCDQEVTHLTAELKKKHRKKGWPKWRDGKQPDIRCDAAFTGRASTKCIQNGTSSKFKHFESGSGKYGEYKLFTSN